MDQPVESFRALFEAIDLGVIYQAKDGRILEANPAARRILGLDEAEIRARDSEDPRWAAIREDGSPFPGIEHPSMVALATGKPLRRVVMGLPQHPDGNLIWISIDATPEFRPGESTPWRVLVTFTDITERKLAEAGRAVSEESFHRLFTEMPLGFSLSEVIRDEGGKVVDYRTLDANPAFEKLTGLELGRIKGRPIREILPGLEASWLERYATVVDSGVSAEFEAPSKDLDRHYYAKAYRAAPERFAVVFNDVSPLLKAEEEVRRLLAEKEQLLKEVHHRIKNSMATITGLLSLQASFQAEEVAAAALEAARNRVTTMQRVYESLFRSPDFRNVQARDFLEGVLSDAVSPYVGSLGGPITVESSFAEATMDAKSLFPLGIIVYELVTNACKYGFPDERHGKVEVAFTATDDGGWLLRVGDDGVGLPGEVNPARPQAFGLTLVKALTEQLGGKLIIEAGPGTRFRIPIPPPKSN